MGVFSKVAGQSAKTFASSGTTVLVTLTANPTAGNIVICGISFYNGAGGGGSNIVSVLDANGNSYFVTPNSPSTYDPNSGQSHLAYLLSAPANANKAITVTFAKTITDAGMIVDEFAMSAGVATFDSDVSALFTGTHIVQPVAAVSATDELLYAMSTVSGSISSANSPWTGSPAGIIPTLGAYAEYLLSANAYTPIDFTQNGTGSSNMAMSIKSVVTPAASINFASLNIGDELKVLRADGKTILGVLTAKIPYFSGFYGEVNNGGVVDYFRETDTLIAQVLNVTTSTINGPSTSRLGPHSIPGQDPYTLGH